jgi:hypothetical protein
MNRHHQFVQKFGTDYSICVMGEKEVREGFDILQQLGVTYHRPADEQVYYDMAIQLHFITWRNFILYSEEIGYTYNKLQFQHPVYGVSRYPIHDSLSTLRDFFESTK